MSEKRIRELAQQSVYESGLSGYIEEALEEPPDVVRLREKLSALQVKREQDLKNTEAEKYDLDTAIGRAFDKGATEAISGVVKLIDTMFHVRLTDDGWEWTDDDGYQDPMSYMDRPDCMP